jgi:hypothetical protein
VLRTRFAAAALFAVALATVAVAQDARTFGLKLKDDKGAYVPFYQEMTTDVAQSIKVQGQDLSQQQKSVFYYQWTPLKEEKAMEGKEEINKITLKQKIEGLKMTIDISGNPISYDSTKADTTAGAGNAGLVEFFKNLKDAEFTATLGKNYKVEKVEGKDAFITKLGAGSPNMDAMLKRVLSDEALKEMVDPTYKVFPDGPKKKGETWERSAKLPLGPIGTYDVTYKFKYAEPDADPAKKDFDKIEVETDIKYTPPKDNADGLLFKIKDVGTKLESVKDGSKGVIYYDSKNQRIAEATINIKLKGELAVVIGGADTKVELSQEQKTVIKTRDTSFLTPDAPKKP